MATFKYPYTVKAHGEIIPPNTEVNIDDPAKTKNTSAAAEKAPVKKRMVKKNAS